MNKPAEEFNRPAVTPQTIDTGLDPLPPCVWVDDNPDLEAIGGHDVPLAVGQATLVRDETGWILEDPMHAQGIWADATSAWAVGEDGTIYRNQGEGWAVENSEWAGSRRLYGIWGQGGRLWAVGDHGGIFERTNEGGWVHIGDHTTSDLLDVWGTAYTSGL